jgi:hypothetical protein
MLRIAFLLAFAMAAGTGGAIPAPERNDSMSWRRPKTIKLCLHPPEAERLVTLWPDGKVVNTEVDRSDRGFGLRLLHGGDAQEFDWTRTQFRVRPDGIPVHGMEMQTGDLVLTLEAFCTWERSPLTYVRVTVRNPRASARRLAMAVMPRTGNDSLLHGIAPDFYASYRPLLAHWDMVPSTWRFSGGTLTDGRNATRLVAPAGLAAEWTAENPRNLFAKGCLNLTARVAASASIHFDVIMGDAPAVAAATDTFEAARADVVSRWQGILAQVRVRPKVATAALRSMTESLVCQSLQMLARGADGVVKPRQGGRSPGVWPTEAIEWLRALDRMGLGAWAEKGYRFLARSQVQDGAERGRILSVGSPSWMNPTGATLYGLAYHLALARDPAQFSEWRETMRLGLEWIAAQRARTRATPGALGYGLLPAGKAHDWGIEGQTWCFTDGFTYLGVREAARTLAQYGDPLASKAQAEAGDYEACLKATLAKVIEGAEGRDEVFIPNLLGVAESYPPVGPYFADGPAMLIRDGIIEPRSVLFERVERYFVRRGWMKNGLTGLMTDCLIQQGFLSDPWAGHTWYTSFPDMAWFGAWLSRGDREKAGQTLEAQVRYGMTTEWTMQERYADNDPTFCPWQPNASANGRLLMQMMDYYGER